MEHVYDFERLRGSHLYAPARRVDAAWRSGVWAEPVDRLLGAGYSFADCGFTASGVLFRALPCGVQAALDAGCLGVGGDGELDLVERVMNVLFVSHERSDAVSVSGLHRGGGDAGIAVFPATVFASAMARGEAAVLAVGDAGVVFRYPLLARPLALDETSALIVHADHAAGLRLPPAMDAKLHAVTGAGRAAVEAGIDAWLAARGLSPARPVAVARWPRRD